MPENSLSLSQLPAMGEPLEGGAFAGIVTQPDGTHVAVVLLPDRGEYLEHPTAVAWAQEHGGQLPTSHIAALLFANVKPLLPPRWHWCPETEGASSAWCCTFKDGTQTNLHKSFECSAVAVRLIPLAALTTAAPAAVAWRELCRRLYVELFYCNQQMTSGKRPKWQQGKTVRDVLADAKAALDAAHQPSPAAQEGQ